MTGLLAVVGHELRERRSLILAVPVLALLPLLSPYLPGLSRWPADEVRTVFVMLIGFALPWALALGLGASALGEEVAGRRLGFYFSRPLSAFAIWGGKMAVALLLPLMASILVYGPLVLTRRDGSGTPWTPWLVSLGMMLVLAGLGHVGATLYRTRSSFLALDLALAALFLGAIYLLGRRLIDAGAGSALLTFGPDLGTGPFWTAGIVGGFLFTLSLVAGFAHVAAGRTDPRSGHLTLSLTLFGGLALGFAAAAGYAAWLLNPTPARLAHRRVLPLADGQHFLFEGSRAGQAWASATFLVDARDGRAKRITLGTTGAVSSPRGQHVLFLEGFLDQRLVVVSAVPGAEPVVSRAPLAEGKEFWPLCLSDDGMLVVLRTGGYARIVDTATGKDRSLPPLEAAYHCTFESPRRLILYGLDPAHGSSYRRVLDLETGAQGGRVDYPEAMGILAVHGDRLLARIRASQPEIGLYDAESGRLLRRLGVAAAWGWEPGVAFLPSGQIAFVGVDPPGTLRIFDPDGRERMTMPFTEGKATLAGANTQGEVFVVLHAATSESTLVVDPETGVTKRRIENLQPTDGPFHSDPVAQVSSSSARRTARDSACTTST
jgi:hypothetical protein